MGMKKEELIQLIDRWDNSVLDIRPIFSSEKIPIFEMPQIPQMHRIFTRLDVVWPTRTFDEGLAFIIAKFIDRGYEVADLDCSEWVELV